MFAPQLRPGRTPGGSDRGLGVLGLVGSCVVGVVPFGELLHHRAAQQVDAAGSHERVEPPDDRDGETDRAIADALLRGAVPKRVALAAVYLAQKEVAEVSAAVDSELAGNALDALDLLREWGTVLVGEVDVVAFADGDALLDSDIGERALEPDDQGWPGVEDVALTQVPQAVLKVTARNVGKDVSLVKCRAHLLDEPLVGESSLHELRELVGVTRLA